MGLKDEIKLLIREVLMEGFQAPRERQGEGFMVAGGGKRKGSKGRVKDPTKDKRLKKNREEKS